MNLAVKFFCLMNPALPSLYMKLKEMNNRCATCDNSIGMPWMVYKKDFYQVISQDCFLNALLILHELFHTP